MSFTGTLQKCNACEKTVYVVDLLSADGVPYHKSCFKCSHCKGTLVMSSYSSMDGVLYCKPHFEQLFKETGSFSKNFHASPKPENKSELRENRTINLASSVLMVDAPSHLHLMLLWAGILYCKHHFSQLFKEKGSYNHLIKATSMRRNAASVPEPKPKPEPVPESDTEAATETAPEPDQTQDQS
ncbi:hypothetical protein IFM89_006684 [Coptis chinensis]|uniref:LIM zinc-binding domain-containing protein n=1 Tax=Coptis chinensis TaxID=261450 RepID=A0A835IXC1_9MAGN|nr:hypothetical protein IFM89_006684 [Coptis chinensis]